MISRELYDKLLGYSKLVRISTVQAREMESLVRSTINPNFVLCTKCPAQIKHGQRLITNYLNTVQVYDEELSEPEPLFDFKAIEVDVDIEEAEKVGCTKCKSKRKVKK